VGVDAGKQDPRTERREQRQEPGSDFGHLKRL
jgi:hypothetical protein